ncbi:MAG: hypothetical protein ACI8QS_001065 [Planctomycetota bacterium]|jgi:hypothetical protein
MIPPVERAPERPVDRLPVVGIRTDPEELPVEEVPEVVPTGALLTPRRV